MYLASLYCQLSLLSRYISTVFVLLQFVVLSYSFLWSLREGAIKEQVVIVEKLQAAERQERHDAQNNDAAQNNDSEDRIVAQDNGSSFMFEAGEIQMMVNPLRARSSCGSAVVAPSKETDDTDDWATHLDEDSGQNYFEHRLSGRVVWALPGDEEDKDEGTGEVEVEVEDVAVEVVEEPQQEEWTTHMDENSGRRYSVNNWTGETVWIDADVTEEEEEAEKVEEPQQEEWTTHMDESSGRRYSINNWTGETVWIDAEVAEEEEENDVGDLATAKSRLRRVMKQSTDGTSSSIDAAFLALVSDTRGDWVEVCDMEGSVLGAQLRGCTVYYNRETYETRLTKPPGWVLLQVAALTGEGRTSVRL
jgi:hypothetical protein